MTRHPTRLYKYRRFDTNSLRALCEEHVYYANPGNFNDPLDCQPVITMDIGEVELEELWLHLYSAEFRDRRAVARREELRTIFDENGHPTADKLPRRELVKKLLVDLDWLLARRLKAWGVLSLSARWNSPLMWSHYADQHRGFCVEYDMSTSYCPIVESVDYSGDRRVRASDLYNWIIRGSTASCKAVFEAYFFAKASDWKYEKEWRVLRKEEGLGGAPFEMSAIYFGVRCESSIRLSIAHMLVGRPLKYYGVDFYSNSSRLRRKRLDVRQMFDDGERAITRDFQDLVLLETAYP